MRYDIQQRPRHLVVFNQEAQSFHGIFSHAPVGFEQQADQPLHFHRSADAAERADGASSHAGIRVTQKGRKCRGRCLDSANLAEGAGGDGTHLLIGRAQGSTERLRGSAVAEDLERGGCLALGSRYAMLQIFDVAFQRAVRPGGYQPASESRSTNSSYCASIIS